MLTQQPCVKRQRIAEGDCSLLLHGQMLARIAARPPPPDHLRLLYPHARDADCYMEELTHTYYVRGKRYSCSVSGVWKVFFEDFDDRMSHRVIKKAEKGLSNLESSVYWLYMHLAFLEGLDINSDDFWNRVENATRAATSYCALTPNLPAWDSDAALAMMQTLTRRANVAKPSGRSCYFLVFCAGYSGESVRSVWNHSGDLEALKGTLLHKQAELFMQHLGAWQREQGRSHVPLQDLYDGEAWQQARAAAQASAAAEAIVGHTKAALWDHPCTQKYLRNVGAEMYSCEYLKFEAWLRARPTLSPYRSEWSIFDEDIGVAGQIDSLWFDEAVRGEDQKPAVVMADWKRAREILSSDEKTQAGQSFGKKGRALCAAAPQHPGPCRDLHDCSFNHYLVQQHLYADFLQRCYAVTVSELLLVQCHPDVTGAKTSYNEAKLQKCETLASEILGAFRAGWHSLLPGLEFTLSANPPTERGCEEEPGPASTI